MSDNVRKQRQTIAEKFEYFSIALDESCDVGDTSQLLVFVLGVDSEFNITEVLVALLSLYGNKPGVIGLFNSHMDDIGAKRPLAIHCIIQVLCSKSMDVDSVMKVVFSTVNFIRANALNHHQFKSFLGESDAEFKDMLYHTDVRWLSRGKVLR